MKLFTREKTLYWKMTSFVIELRIVGILLSLACYLCTSLWLMAHADLKWSILGGFITAIFAFLLTLPAWFISPTPKPNPFQRFCRNYVIGCANKTSFLCSPSGESMQIRDIRAFQYYLSHPQQKENILADQIDPTQFDWQNPSNWPL